MTHLKAALATCVVLLLWLSVGCQTPTVGAPRKYLTLDLGKGVTMKLVLIPAGTFTMGSPKTEKGRHHDEGPQRKVTISRPFYMGITEVAQEEYEAVIGRNPAHFVGAQNPVEQVSWDEAVAFCKALSKKTGKTARLSTEAEWEYACRADTTTAFNTGNKLSRRRANYNGKYIYELGNLTLQETTPWPIKLMAVRSFKPNPWGLYDMHGNVWEWCSDRHARSYANAKAVDPQGPASGKYRVMRGGGWYDSPRYCRSATRHWDRPDLRSYSSGFRVVVVSGRGD